MYQTYLAGVSCRKDGFKNCPSDGQPHIHFHSSTDLTMMEAGMFSLDFLVPEDHESFGFYRPQPIPEKDRFKRGTAFLVFDMKKVKAVIDGPDCADPTSQCHDPRTCPTCQSAEFMATHSACELTAKKLLQDVAAYARGLAPLTEEVKSVLGPFMNTERDLRNLLAVIHRDGGHYVERNGINSAVEDALKIVSNLLVVEDAWKSEQTIRWCTVCADTYTPRFALQERCTFCDDRMKEVVCMCPRPGLNEWSNELESVACSTCHRVSQFAPNRSIKRAILSKRGAKLANPEKLTALFVDTFKKLTLCEECGRGGECYSFKCGVRKKNIEYAAEQFRSLTTESEPMNTTDTPIAFHFHEDGVFVHNSSGPVVVIGDTIYKLDGLKLAQEDEISRLRGRIDELFAYNNEQVERRRAAENRVKELEAKLLKGEDRVIAAPKCSTDKCGRTPGPERRMFFNGECCKPCTTTNAEVHTAECEERWRKIYDGNEPLPGGGIRRRDMDELASTPYPAPQAVESAEDQIKRLGIFIMENVPGEPSQSEGAVDTAIRVLQSLLTTMGAYAEDIFSLVRKSKAEAPTADEICDIEVWDNMDARMNPCGQTLPCRYHAPKKTKASEIRDFAVIMEENNLYGDLAQGLEKTEYKGRSMTDRLREKMEEAGVRLGSVRIHSRVDTWPQVDEWNDPDKCGECGLKKGDSHPDEPSVSYRFTFTARDGRGWFVRGYYCNDCHNKLTRKPDVGALSTVSGSAASAGGDSDDVPLLSSSDESRPSGAHVSTSEQLCESVRSTRG